MYMYVGLLTLGRLNFCTYSDDDCSSIAVDNVWIGEVTLTVEAALIIGTCRKNVARRTFNR